METTSSRSRARTLSRTFPSSATTAPPYIHRGQSKADFVLEEEAIKLDDVVVIGYGAQNKRDVTTSIASIKAEDFAEHPDHGLP